MARAPTIELTSIHVRAKAWQRDLIDQAADRLCRSRSDFMLEASYREAQEVLRDQSLATMGSGAFGKFQKLLDKPLPPNNELRKLLTMKAPWGK